MKFTIERIASSPTSRPRCTHGQEGNWSCGHTAYYKIDGYILCHNHSKAYALDLLMRAAGIPLTGTGEVEAR